MSPALLLLFAAAAQPISLPEEIKTKPGRLVQIQATTEAKKCGWDTDPARADLVPCCAGGPTALFTAPAPGRYRVVAWTDAEHKAVCTVVVGDAPAPGPAPPAPAPGPPADPFQAALQAAYDREPAGTRSVDRDALVRVYRAGADRLCPDPRIVTVSSLLTALRQTATHEGLAEADLRQVRTVIAGELQAILGTDGNAHFPRESTADRLHQIARHLEALH